MVGVSLEEAELVLAGVREKNPSLGRFKRLVWDRYRENDGINYTLFGRRLVYPHLMINPYQKGWQRIWDKWDIAPGEARSLRAQAERQSFNAVIQGTAGDLFKSLIMECRAAFSLLEDELKIVPEKKAQLLAQIHDEVIFEVEEEYVERYKQVMTKVLNRDHLLPGGVPIRAEANYGHTWLQAKGE